MLPWGYSVWERNVAVIFFLFPLFFVVKMCAIFRFSDDLVCECTWLCIGIVSLLPALLVAFCQHPASLTQPFCRYAHEHKQPATLSLCRRCEGIAAKVLKMLLSIKRLRRRHRAPRLLFMSSLWLISRRAFTREEIQILPPAQVWFLVACNLLSKLEPSFRDPDVLTLYGCGCVCVSLSV